MGDWIILLRSTGDGFLNPAAMCGLPPYVAGTLAGGAGIYFQKHDPELAYKFWDPMAADTVNLTYLSADDFRRVYSVIKRDYENFNAGIFEPHVYRILDKPELDARMMANRKKYFDIFMKLLDEDPRLQDPPPENLPLNPV